MLPTKRSAIALARGARTGVLMMRMSVAVNTASNAAVNLASRSRMRNRKRRPASSRSMSRLRACVEIQHKRRPKRQIDHVLRLEVTGGGPQNSPVRIGDAVMPYQQ